jgi:hypothetical protein
MSDEENRWKWNEFLEIGNSVHNPQIMRGQVRILEAKRALRIANQLIENDFIINLSIKDQQLYKILLPKIACYLDGSIEVIQVAVEKYFYTRHCKAGLDEDQFKVSYSLKNSGIQTGFTCDISDGNQTTRYFIKTHQHGPSEDNPKSLKPPDTKELFIYRFLYYLEIGPDVHFIIPTHGSKVTTYIASKDCHLTLLSHLTNDTVCMKSLVQLDLISRILCLRDCTTNYSNCGQVNGKPMIVDFRIERQSGGYVKSDIIEKFCEGNGEFNYSGLMALTVGVPREEKICILRESLQTWNLLENIDRTLLGMHQLVQKIVSTGKGDDDLQRYIQDVKETVKILSQA